MDQLDLKLSFLTNRELVKNDKKIFLFENKQS